MTVLQIGGLADSLKAAPVTSISAAYASGDCIGIATKLRIGAPASGRLTAILQNITVVDRNAQKAPIDYFFFSAEPKASTITDNAPFVMDDADDVNLIGIVSLLNYVTAGAKAVGEADQIAKAMKGDDTGYVWIVRVVRATPTFTTAAALQETFNLLQD